MVEFIDPLTGITINFHLDEKLKNIWDKLRDGKLAELNEDRVYLIDGRERTGKSSFAFQQAKYLDPTFTTDRICFKPEEFLRTIRTAKPGTVVVFDEAFRGLSSKASRSKVNKAIVEALMEVGQKNLIIFIVLPTLFLLEIYAAVFRSECLFHVYKIKPRKGGKKYRAFKIYNYEKKKQLYLRGRAKYFSYSKPRIYKAKGRFLVKKTKEWPTGIPYETFDMKAYLAKKKEAFDSNGETEEDKEENLLNQDIKNIITGIHKDFIHSVRKLSVWLEKYNVRRSKTSVWEMVGKEPEIEENSPSPPSVTILEYEEEKDTHG